MSPVNSLQANFLSSYDHFHGHPSKALKMGPNCPKRKPDRVPSIIFPHGRSLLNFRGVYFLVNQPGTQNPIGDYHPNDSGRCFWLGFGRVQILVNKRLVGKDGHINFLFE